MNTGSVMTAVGGLVVVLALALLAGRLVRILGLAPGLAPGLKGGAAGTRRLVLAETLALDPRRRLQLVQCDGQDLLVLTGGPQDVLLALKPSPPAPVS